MGKAKKNTTRAEQKKRKRRTGMRSLATGKILRFQQPEESLQSELWGDMLRGRLAGLIAQP